MAKAARARATPHRGSSLPDEIVVWEILIRLPPKSLLRCRSVCRAWRRVTCTRDFLLAHHGCQPSFLLFSGDDQYIIGVHYRNMIGVHYHNILAFDHRVATDDDQLHTVAQLDEVFYLEASCDGLLVLSKADRIDSNPCLSICNPATREHAPLGLPWDLDVLGMYPHRPTGDYRLLLQQRRCKVEDQAHADQIGCYVFSLGSDQPPMYIGRPEMALGLFNLPVRMRDSLHWCPVYYPSGTNPSTHESNVVVVFDTVAESLRQMRAPIAPTASYIFEMDDTLGIHSRNYAMETIDIWVLQNYESEVWNLKYRIKLPVAKIWREFENSGDRWNLNVVSVDGGVILLLKVDGWLLHVDNDGKLVKSFNRRRRGLFMSGCRLKQSLVQHTFFPALEGYAVNASPFIGPIE